MKNKKPVIQGLMVLCSLFFLLASGCGKKGPPLPPEIKGQKIAAPFDLKYAYGKKIIVLSWNHRIDNENAVIKPLGFEIFMARKTFEACEGCPFKFKKIGFVSAPSMEFTIPIEKGYKYYFRVQATGDDNMRSEYSKTVQFEYQ
jgi:predicted small lipoprotein YifL